MQTASCSTSAIMRRHVEALIHQSKLDAIPDGREIEEAMKQMFGHKKLKRIEKIERRKLMPSEAEGFPCELLPKLYGDLVASSQELSAVKAFAQKKAAKTFAFPFAKEMAQELARKVTIYYNVISYKLLPRFEDVLGETGAERPSRRKRGATTGSTVSSYTQMIQIMVRSRLRVEKQVAVLERWKDTWVPS
jgi:hypothetical protein